MRKARSVAWFSTAGFHQRSKWMTCAAAVKFRPVPPALRERMKNGGPSALWKCSTRALRFDTLVPPCNTTPPHAIDGFQRRLQRLHSMLVEFYLLPGQIAVAWRLGLLR